MADNKSEKKILIIDDDDQFAASVKELLVTEGYTAIIINNTKKGLDTVKTEKPDLIVLDVMMDYRTEGFDFCRELRQHEEFNDVEIIMATGIRREMNLPFNFEPDEVFLPAATVIEKPIEPSAFLKTIENILSKKKV